MSDELGVRVFCSCKSWAVSAHQIFKAQVESTLHTGVEYTGRGFRYCPWCGKTLSSALPFEHSEEVEVFCQDEAPFGSRWVKAKVSIHDERGVYIDEGPTGLRGWWPAVEVRKPAPQEPQL